MFSFSMNLFGRVLLALCNLSFYSRAGLLTEFDLLEMMESLLLGRKVTLS